MTFISKLAHPATETGFKSTFSYILLFAILTEKSIILGFKNRNLEPRLKGVIEVLCSTTLQSFYSSYSPATTSHEFIIGWTSSSGHFRSVSRQKDSLKSYVIYFTFFIL